MEQNTDVGGGMARFMRRFGISILGVALMTLWGIWWGNSLRHNHLVSGHRTWIPCYSFMNLDFLSVYYDTCHWYTGGDPYRENVRPFHLDYCFSYPPIVLRIYAWCHFVRPQVAAALWTAALTVMVSLGAWAAWRTRRRLGLSEVPLPLVVAGVLFSTAVFYAVERGNCDLLVLVLVVLGAWALQGKTLVREGFAGSVFALAAWIKIYPGLLIIGLLALRRWRAALCFLLVAVAIGLADLKGTQEFLHNMRYLAGTGTFDHHGFWSHTTHSFSGCWRLLWTGTPLRWLLRIPAKAGAACFIMPAVLWVNYRLWRCPNARLVIYPYLVWLVAAATFVPPVANDYSLVFLPVAVLAVWDRRDALWIHVLMAFLLLWWQPFVLPIGPRLLFAFKYLGLLAAGGSLLTRMREAGEGVLKVSTPETGYQIPPAAAA